MQLPLYLMFMYEYIRHFFKNFICVVAHIRHFAFIRHFVKSPTTNMTRVADENLGLFLAGGRGFRLFKKKKNQHTAKCNLVCTELLLI